MTVKLRQLEIIYGTVEGARAQFENLIEDMVHKDNDGARRVRVQVGDGGIDVYVGNFADPGGIDVFQVKYFAEHIDDPQKAQIRESFKRCSADSRFKVKTWTLCIACNMSADEIKWFDGWAVKQASTGIRIEKPWTAAKVEGLLNEEKYRDLRESYFQEEYRTQVRETHQTVSEIKDKISQKDDLQVLIPHFVRAACYKCCRDNTRVVLAITLHFQFENPSTTFSVKKWSVKADLACPQDLPNTLLTREHFPRLGTGKNYIETDRTVLPTTRYSDIVYFGLPVDPASPIHGQLVSALHHIQLQVKGVSENHVPPFTTFLLREIVDFNALTKEAEGAIKELRRAEAPKEVTFLDEMPVVLDRELGFHAIADGKTLKCRITFTALVQWFYLQEHDMRTLRGAFLTYRSEIESFARIKIRNGEAPEGLIITQDMVDNEVHGGKGNRLGL